VRSIPSEACTGAREAVGGGKQVGFAVIFFFVRNSRETKLNEGSIKRFSHEEQGVRVVDQAVKSTVWWLEVVALNWPRPGTIPISANRWLTDATACTVSKSSLSNDEQGQSRTTASGRAKLGLVELKGKVV
jgi:hypothetical protein